MSSVGNKILDILNVTPDDDTNSIIAKTMVLQARKESNFMDLLMSEPASQVMWIDKFSDDTPLAVKYQELETISSFLRTLKVIRNVYVEEGWL